MTGRTKVGVSVIGLVLLAGWVLAAGNGATTATTLQERLRAAPFKLAYECYVNGNWEIFVARADGSDAVNLTSTPAEHEHYPQVSPDGSRIAFLADRGAGRDAVRGLYVMKSDGTGRKKVADYAREPFWSPDNERLAYLSQEYPRFSVMDYYTKGMQWVELATGAVRPHPNSANFHHLYNPSFAGNGKWIVATVHGGMGFGHAILLLEAQGHGVRNLEIPGCRPRLSPDGKQIAWSAGDHEIAVAPLDLDAAKPVVGSWRLRVKDEVARILHVAWSPDSRFLSFSRGPEGRGDPTKAGTFEGAAGIVGVYAAGWDVAAVSAEQSGTLDLHRASASEFALLTTNGLSNKQPVWFRPARARE